MQPTNLRDAHLHLIAHGAEAAAVDLTHATSVDDALERVAHAARHADPGAWIRARGARPEAWTDRRFPAAAELDDAAGQRPALVASFDFHSGAASTAALDAAGIARDSADPPGGIVERDPRGHPTGVVREAAYKAVLAAMPEPTEDQELAWLRAAQRDLLDRGFVEVNEMMAPPRLAGLLRRMEADDELRLVVRVFATHDVLPSLVGHFREHTPTDRVRMGGLKLFLDGTLNSRTAHMLEPYADPLENHPHGTPLIPPDDLDRHLGLCQAAHIDCAIHAIGDAAVRAALDAYERIDHPSFHLRIEHAQFIHEDDIPRFASLGVVASMQPCHLLTDVEAIERLVPHRAHRAFPLRDLIDAATAAGREPWQLIELGSDAPVVPPDPRDNLLAAVERGRGDGKTIAPEQTIGERACWELMVSRA